jgi:GAF domain-containing protein
MDVATIFAKSIASAARSLNQQESVEATLQTIATVMANSVPGFDHVGISTVDKAGHVTTRAHVGRLVMRLDDLQYGLGEGPCVDALNGDDLVVVPHLGSARRWPRYVPEATELGIRSQLALRLHLGDGSTLGGVNLYSTISDEVDGNARALAALFGAHSAIALGHVQERAQLSAALESRKVVGQAVGILMQRHGLSEDRAFALLVRASNDGNIRLRTVAQELVDELNAS